MGTFYEICLRCAPAKDRIFQYKLSRRTNARRHHEARFTLIGSAHSESRFDAEAAGELRGKNRERTVTFSLARTWQIVHDDNDYNRNIDRNEFPKNSRFEH